MKTNIRVFVSLLVLAAMLVSMPISALAMDDNPEDSVLDSVGKDDVMDVNKGTVTANDGTITANHGKITTNNGAVEINGDGDGDGDGVDDSANGIVSINNGQITTNNYYVETNGENGTIGTNNCVVGNFFEFIFVVDKIEKGDDVTMETGNFGTVTNNNSTIVYNGEGGVVETNGVIMTDEEGNEVSRSTGLIFLNQGTVNDNNHSVWFNFGTVKTSDDTVGENYGIVEDNNETLYENFGTVVNNDGLVLSNHDTIKDNNAYVGWNGGTIEVNNVKGIVGIGTTTDEDGNTISGTVGTNYGTLIVDNTFYYGLELKSAGGEMETKLIQTVQDTNVNLTDLFTQDGYELVGYIQTYQRPEGDQTGLFEEDPIMVYSTEFKVEHPNLLNLIWYRIPPYLGLSVGNSLWTNGQLLKVIAVEENNYVLATCGTFPEEDMKDLSATLGKLLTPWQMDKLIGEPQILSPEMTAEFFGDNGFHITFTLPKTAL